MGERFIHWRSVTAQSKIENCENSEYTAVLTAYATDMGYQFSIAAFLILGTAISVLSYLSILWIRKHDERQSHHDVRNMLQVMYLRVRARIPDRSVRNSVMDMFDSMLAVLGARREERGHFDVIPLLRKLCDNVVLDDRDAELEKLRVDGWKLHMLRALANLIDNAQYHGQGPVEIHVRMCKESWWPTRRVWVEIDVCDRGDGPPQEIRDRIQKTIGLRVRNSKGGTGLSVVRSVVHRHGGTVAYYDRPGGGVIARVRLPAIAEILE